MFVPLHKRKEPPVSIIAFPVQSRIPHGKARMQSLEIMLIWQLLFMDAHLLCIQISQSFHNPLFYQTDCLK